MAAPAKIITAEPAESIAPPPDSGVRESIGKIDLPAAEGPRSLSYSIYTAAELESHIVESQRMAPPPIHVPGWPELSTAGRDAGRGLLAWARLPKPRPRPMDVCRPQLEELGTVTKAVLAAIPWRRIGAVTGMVFGCIAFLLFAVITVGELTDDVKPGKRAESTSLALKAPAPIVTAAAPIVTAAPAPAPTSFEIIDATPAPKALKKKRGKRPAPGPERFVP